MPSPYVGGYFSQVVVSALYPLIVTDGWYSSPNNLVRIEHAEVPHDSWQPSALLQDGALEDTIAFVSVNAPPDYWAVSDSMLSSGILVTVGVPVTYTGYEYERWNVSLAALDSGALVVTIQFVTYTDVPGKWAPSNVALTAGTLV